MTNLDSILKAETLFSDKDPYIWSYNFSSSQVRMWELDYIEGWVLKNWSFWIVVLEKTIESPLDSKEIISVNPKRNQPWISIGKTDAEVPMDLDAGKDWGQEDKGTTENEVVGWHHQLDGHEFEQTLGDGEGQGSLACCNPCGHKEWETT